MSDKHDNHEEENKHEYTSEDYEDFGFSDENEDEEYQADAVAKQSDIDEEIRENNYQEEQAPLKEQHLDDSSKFQYDHKERLADELLDIEEDEDIQDKSQFEAIWDWILANKLLAGGAIILVIFILSLFLGGNKQNDNMAINSKMVDVPKSNDGGKDSISDFFNDDKDIASLAYRPKEIEENYSNSNNEKKDIPEKQAETYSNKNYIDNKIDNINKKLGKIDETLNELKGLQNVISSMHEQLMSRNKVIKSNESEINALKIAINSLNKNIQNMQKDMFRSALLAANLSNKTEEQGPDYIVQASIPGRAWLKNKDGVLITVKEGQEIPGFGKVKKIDPSEGQVIMSNDVVFKEEE